MVSHAPVWEVVVFVEEVIENTIYIIHINLLIYHKNKVTALTTK